MNIDTHDHSANNNVRQNSHGHDHAHSTEGVSGSKIFWVTCLNVVITLTEFLGGIISGSLSLLSDSLHNAGDSSALVLSYVANRVSKRPKDSKKTFGYKRIEILTAFINASVLLSISLFLIFEAVRRWNSPETIDGSLMTVIALIGLVANLASVLVLRKDSKKNLNIRSSFMHLLGDTLSSVGVVLGGLAIRFWGVIWVDPLITLFVSLFIIWKSWEIIRQTTNILMQSAAPLNYNQIKADIESIEHVNNIHHIHTWMVDDRTIHFEAHIDMDDMSLCEVEPIYGKIQNLLIEKYGVSHVTLQAEVDLCKGKNIF